MTSVKHGVKVGYREWVFFVLVIFLGAMFVGLLGGGLGDRGLSAQAAVVTWDADTSATGAQDGGGTWNTSNNNWWTGSANTSWSNSTPDNAIIGAGTGTGSGAYTISLGTNITVGQTGNTAPAIQFNSPGGTRGYTIAGVGVTLTLNTPEINVNYTTPSGAPHPTISAPIAGSAGLTKTGDGRLVLSGNNTYTGVTTVSKGFLRINHANALGQTGTGNHTVVSSGATLEVDGGITVNEPITIEGDGVSWASALRSVSAGNTWAGQISIPGGSWARVASAAGTFTISGGVGLASGTSAVLRFSGGRITVNTNPITLGATGTVDAVNAGTDVTIAVSGNTWGYTTVSWGATLRLGVANALPSNVILTLGSSGNWGEHHGYFDMGGFNQTIGGLQDVRLTAQGNMNNNRWIFSTGSPTLTINHATTTVYDFGGGDQGRY